MSRPSRGASLVTTAALVLLCGAAVVSAHNPALTIYEPVALDDGLLVLGEEGTAAFLTPDGQEVWRADLDRHVLQAPVAGHGLAVSVTRNLTTLAPSLQAFDAEGPAWTTPLDPEASGGYVVPTEAGFVAFTDTAQATTVGPDGQVGPTFQLPLTPSHPPTQLPDGGWALADRTEIVVTVDAEGQEQARLELPGRPGPTSIHEDRLLATWGDVRSGRTGVLATTPDLEEVWSYEVPGLRVGGDLAVTEAAVYLATLRPAGSIVAAVTAEGQPLWNRTLESTAGAVTVDGDQLLVAVNGGLLSLTPEGAERWTQPMSPRLVSPTVAHGLVLPSGANDTLVAVDPATGVVAWTWEDGNRQVPWTDEELARQGDSEPPGPADARDDPGGPTETPAAALPLLTAAALTAALLRGRAPRPRP